MGKSDDREKFLVNEIGRYQKKVEDQGREIARLHAERKENEDGMRQLHRAVDAIVAEMAMRYGEEKADGVRELRIPGVNVMTEPQYVVRTVRDELSGEYIIRVRRGGAL